MISESLILHYGGEFLARHHAALLPAPIASAPPIVFVCSYGIDGTNDLTGNTDVKMHAVGRTSLHILLFLYQVHMVLFG
jgi:hypothetical protein